MQSFRGGARVGWVNASWPFAKFTISSRKIELSSLGTYTFGPSDVVAFESYGSIPVLASGIRIRHNRADYPENIIFWCFGGRAKVLDTLAKAGFVPEGQTVSRPSGSPVRWTVIILAIALWNVLFLLDRSAPGPRHTLGPFSFGAILMLFAAATAVRVSPRFQRVVLREGHQVGEIHAFLVLLQIVLGLLCAIFATMLLLGRADS